MNLHRKIISLPTEIPDIKRRTPEIDLAAIRPLEAFHLALAGLLPLHDTGVQQNLKSFIEKYDLDSPGFRESGFDSLFNNKAFTAALREKNNRSLAIYFVEKLLEEKEYFFAHKLVLRLIEHITYPDVKVGPNEILVLKLQMLAAETNSTQYERSLRDISSRQTEANGIIKFYFIFCMLQNLLSCNRPKVEDFLKQFRGKPVFPHWLAAMVQGELIENPTPEFYEEAYRLASEEYKLSSHIPHARAFCANIIITALLRMVQACGDGLPSRRRWALQQIESWLSKNTDQPLYFSSSSMHSIYMALGEFSLEMERGDKAQKYFSESSPMGGNVLLVLTRRNEANWAKAEASSTLEENWARRAIHSIDEEIKARKTAKDNGPKEEITHLLTQKYLLARKAGLVEVGRQALAALLISVRGTPIEPAILVFAASQLYSDKGTRKQVKKTAIPDSILPSHPIHRWAVKNLIGTDDPELLAEEVKVQKREIMSSGAASLIEVVKVPVRPLADMLKEYEAREDEMRGRLQDLWQRIEDAKQLLYSAEVVNGYRLLTEAGIKSFVFKADRGRKCVTVKIVNFQDESFEALLNKDSYLDLSSIRDHDFYRLLTLILIDFFLKSQIGADYSAVFEQIDFKFFNESEFLNAAVLVERVGFIYRPPSRTESMLEDLELERDDIEENEITEEEEIE
ncbi:MAG: hypothetical protein KKH83_06445, partial [Candidatus Margulisbacteria bacterium]|nr:hypothetical protein [Candidatus Margulisiibacteriota bacterium]